MQRLDYFDNPQRRESDADMNPEQLIPEAAFIQEAMARYMVDSAELYAARIKMAAQLGLPENIVPQRIPMILSTDRQSLLILPMRWERLLADLDGASCAARQPTFIARTLDCLSAPLPARCPSSRRSRSLSNTRRSRIRQQSSRKIL